ncbi:DEAD-domain-containing protein [Trichodelitschia bisporula]|uniref:RNA helicase n=1 Tax=Trichodelitschia bisporula TaxID=703511 RepID=A0A6G1I4H6_9PEZI|nr:DEAD-domain-containing protein [Trichodelitschia bisporula]
MAIDDFRKRGEQHAGQTKKSKRVDSDDEEDALASDFEFQLDDGVVEEFDGWTNVDAKPGDKKAVDIDGIIERRRAATTKREAKKKRQAEERGDFTGFDDEAGDTSDSEATAEADLEAEENIADDDALDADDAASASDADDVASNVVSDDALEPDADAGAEDHSDTDYDSDASIAKPVAHPDDFASDSEEEEEDDAEKQRKADFFAPEPTDKAVAVKTGSFQAMGLSRPILKGLAAIGFTEPTPIQAKAIPVALLGTDIVGGAETGSGKTAAFMIPILERLLYRSKKVATTRVAILMPTRELAVQCFAVAKKLAAFTDITFAQIIGGFSLREQEQVLKRRPDVIIATPGRFIDHMRNSPSFAVDAMEILVLDEADRMLEDGFADELNEILNTIPKARQTMLFSATMTDSVDKLIRVGLTRPARLMVDAKRQVVSGLVQEFVRLRPGREDKRLAALVWLAEHAFHDKTIVFFRQKKEAHRVRVVFGLRGLKAAELHGSMSQEQRIAAVESFRSGTASFLLATDLASRGLDIKNVATVINYEAPQSHEIYLHRVGRTARAGRTGRACTIAAEPDRKIVKAAVRAAKAQGAKVVSRVLPVAEIDALAATIEGMEGEIEAVLKEEKEEKILAITERDLKKGENLVVHEREIMARPRRTWFETEEEKKKARAAGHAELNAGPGEVIVKTERKRLSNKDRKKMDTRDERKAGLWKKGKTDRLYTTDTHITANKI